MRYINKKLTIEKLSVDKIAKKYGTPAYCYSFSQFRKNILKAAKETLNTACQSKKNNLEVSFLLTSDSNIRLLNKNYRNKDKSTNVLAFPMNQKSFGENFIVFFIVP